ncbi:hypothetical protein ACB092_12G109100 [Castanea dentata]
MSQRKEARPPMTLRRRTKQDDDFPLPDEIVLEILARLPVKSLLRFRCVCQTWYSFITNPNFISTHLLCYNNNNNNNHDDDGYVIHMPRSPSLSQICTVASDRTFETISEFRIPFTLQYGYLQLGGSCNGILCVADYWTFATMDVYLWNPSIRIFKRLPNTCLPQLPTVALGFGYDSQNNDYKVVRISWIDPKPMSPSEVQVYSLSSDSWKRVELGISWMPKFNFTLTFPFVSGHLHWMITKIEGGGGGQKTKRRCTDMILSLDVNSEKFKELPLPDEEGKCIKEGLASFKGKLALIRYGIGAQPYSTLCSIWVMTEYGVLDSWNKLCVLPIENPSNFIGTFTNYGLLLVQKWSWLVSTNSELGRNHKSVLIDLETLHEKEISNQVDFRLDLAAYMESLALLDGANVVSY